VVGRWPNLSLDTWGSASTGNRYWRDRWGGASACGVYVSRGSGVQASDATGGGPPCGKLGGGNLTVVGGPVEAAAPGAPPTAIASLERAGEVLLRRAQAPVVAPAPGALR